MTYLVLHPPARTQYRYPRRATVTGAICLHDAENVTDLDGPDSGAEAVARFIQHRTDPGSYHSIVDSDSIVRLVPYDAEAYGEGTGGNPHALHLALAYGSRWTPTPEWWAKAITNAATAARDMADWVHATTGVAVPARRITADQYRAGAPGFIPHADLDPKRRSDPVGFPWDPFLALYANTTAKPPTPKETLMAVTQPTLTEIEAWVSHDFAAVGNPDLAGQRYWAFLIADAADWRVPVRDMRRQLGLK